MKVAPVGKAALVIAIAVAFAAYALVVDLGMSAGQIHAGVTVRGLDVGGLTEAEAAALLEERGHLLQQTPIVFSTEGFDCRFVPAELGWGPQPFDTARSAMAVGRSGGWTQALADRWRAWTGGVDVPWAGSPDPGKVGRFLNQCEELAEGLGLELDRGRTRFLIRRTIETWPRAQILDLPVSSF